MEVKNYISFPFATQNEEREERSNPLAPTHLTWSTRWRCCQTYLCLSISFMSMLNFCEDFNKYGCAILVPYLLFTAIIGAPGVLAEIMFGRYGGGSVLRSWSMCPPAKGLFMALFVVTCCRVIERNLFIVFLIKYFFSCFYGEIRWEHCNKNWAKENCFDAGKKEEALVQCLAKNSKEYCESLNWETSTFQYWKYVISSSRGISLLWSVISSALAISLNIVYTFKGIYSFEKTLAFFVYPVFASYGVLGVVSLSVPNAIKGFINLCSFGWSNMSNLNLWIEGFHNVFLTNCIGTISLSFLSGHGAFTDNILIDVFTVTFISFISCLLFAIPFLCVIKSTAEDPEELNIETEEVIVIMSQALLQYPWPIVLWSSLYFFCAILMSLSSQAVLILAIAEALQNLFKMKSTSFWIMLLSVALFILTILTDILKMKPHYNAGRAGAVTFILITMTWQLFYGIENFKTDFHFMMGFPVPFLVKCTWFIQLALPITILLLDLYIGSETMLHNVNDSILCTSVIIIYILNIMYCIIKFKKEKKKIISVFTADPNWGPDDALLKKSRKLFGVSTVTRDFTYRQELNKKPLEKPPEFSQQNIVSLL